jgi:hypothetical protein
VKRHPGGRVEAGGGESWLWRPRYSERGEGACEAPKPPRSPVLDWQRSVHRHREGALAAGSRPVPAHLRTDFAEADRTRLTTAPSATHDAVPVGAGTPPYTRWEAIRFTTFPSAADGQAARETSVSAASRAVTLASNLDSRVCRIEFPHATPAGSGSARCPASRTAIEGDWTGKG